MNDPVYQLTEKYWKSRGGFVNPSVDKFYDWLLEQEKSKDVEAAIEWAGKYYRVPAHYPSDNRPLSDFRAWYKTTLEDHP
jgi:hypothetical protein